MRRSILFGLTFVVLVSGGCSSSEESPGTQSTAFPCDNLMSKCPNDPPFPPDTCRKITSDPRCGTASQVWLRCVGDHQVCGADGMTDQTATNQACTAENLAAIQCAAGFDAGSD